MQPFFATVVLTFYCESIFVAVLAAGRLRLQSFVLAGCDIEALFGHFCEGEQITELLASQNLVSPERQIGMQSDTGDVKPVGLDFGVTFMFAIWALSKVFEPFDLAWHQQTV